MAFDMQQTMDDMLAKISGIILEDSAEIKNCAQQALEKQKSILEKIAKARIKKEINNEEMQSHLQDEKLVLEAALLVCQVKAKIIANKAANAAINQLANAIINAL